MKNTINTFNLLLNKKNLKTNINIDVNKKDNNTKYEEIINIILEENNKLKKYNGKMSDELNEVNKIINKEKEYENVIINQQLKLKEYK